MAGEASRENGKQGGRPPGKQNKTTLERAAVKRKLDQRIMRVTDQLFEAQFTLARGATFLWRIDTETDEKGRTTRSKPVRVTDPEEIEQYLEGEVNGEPVDEDSYYYISTERPDNKAIDSMIDRVHGKSTQKLGTDPEHPLEVKTALSPEAETKVRDIISVALNGVTKE